MTQRQELLERLLQLDDCETEAPPLVPLEQWFEGNTHEQSIAPNCWGEGRPALSEIYRRMKTIAAYPEVQSVWVGLHFDWCEALEDDSVWPAAENIHILTSAEESRVETWIEGLYADGVFRGWPYGEHPCAPTPDSNQFIYSICWD